MLQKPLRSVIVGLGHRSLEDHLPLQMRPNPFVELVGVQDTDPTKEAVLQDMAGQLGVNAAPPFFTDLGEMLAKVSPDMAVVATPHYTHLEVASLLLNAGIPVLKEKPFARNFAEAKTLANLIDKTNGHMRLEPDPL